MLARRSLCPATTSMESRVLAPSSRSAKSPLPERVACYPFTVESESLTHYAQSLQLPGPSSALRALARAIAFSLGQRKHTAGGVLVCRPSPQPHLALFGSFDKATESGLAAQARELSSVCGQLRYVDYPEAAIDCERLASRLVDHFGNDIDQVRFVAIPRGGLIVLGLLSIALGVGREQLEPRSDPQAPLVVVDDCAISGARFASFVESCDSQHIVFAHLYSHPLLRAAIEADEPHIEACLSARDLSETELAGLSPGWRQRWSERIECKTYWVGRPGTLCFPWSEPDRRVWNAYRQQAELGWRVVPPELCSKNRALPGRSPLAIQIQPEGKGPLKPSPRVVFAILGESVVIGELESSKTYLLEGVAADAWRSLLEHGNFDDVTSELGQRYAVPPANLRRDVAELAEEMIAGCLLEHG